MEWKKELLSYLRFQISELDYKIERVIGDDIPELNDELEDLKEFANKLEDEVNSIVL